VYQAYGIDSSNGLHRVIVDVGSDNVLNSTKIEIANGSGVGLGSWPNHGFGWGR
jgi:hypothetical protein